MKNKKSTELVDRAVKFAVDAHAGVMRRGKTFPYAVHPLEAMSIVATISSDHELLAAAVLHDVIEDTEYTAEDIENNFGKRVADLVLSETDTVFDGVSKELSWHERKKLALEHLKAASLDTKIVALGDKLSNMRAIARDYAVKGDELWKEFHVKDKNTHAWRYKALTDALSDLSGTEAYEEFRMLVEKVFG